MHFRKSLDSAREPNEIIQHDSLDKVRQSSRVTNKIKHKIYSLPTFSINVNEWTQQPTQEARLFVKIAGKKLRLPHAMYKGYMESKKEPLWLSATMLPVQMLIDYIVE
jgi:hypothetical protein